MLVIIFFPSHVPLDTLRDLILPLEIHLFANFPHSSVSIFNMLDKFKISKTGNYLFNLFDAAEVESNLFSSSFLLLILN